MEQQEEVQTMRDELATLDDNENPNVLTHLTLSRCSTGLFGRTLLQFSFPSLSLRQAKPHQFTVGDLVQIRVQKNTPTGGKLPTGIVSRVEERGISVAVNSDQEDVDEVELLAATGITLDRLVNNATFLKLTSALDQMTKFEFGAAQAVVDVVFSEREPSWNTPLPDITPFNKGLNESQVEAIRLALASKDLALIHGPPGTGKTTTVVEFILQAVTRFDLKVLVCAPSNIAVDNVLDKLASTCSTLGKTLKLTRIGHPARVLPQILKYCLDAKIESAEGTEIVNDIRQEMTAMQKKLQKTRDKSLRYQLRREMKTNRKEIRTREQKVVGDIVRHSNVVFATNVGAASKLLKDVTFDLVIIDEAAQALEASCWIPILKAKRCVLAGDHLQLPPTIKSKTAAAKGLEVTLFDRIASYTNTQSIVKMLDTQYRMHEDISEWSSQAMYKGELKSFEGVAKLVCDTDTISSHKFLAVLVKHFEKFGEYRSAQEYLDEDVVEGTMDEQLVMSLSVAASTAPTTSSSKSAADTKATKTTKLKQVKKSNKALKAAAGASKVVEAKKAAPNDENPQAMEAKETIATVTLDEEKEKDEVEDKPVAVKSVFQMMNSDSDSSDDENEEGNIDPGEEGSSSLTEDLKAANSLLKDLHMSRLARQPPPAPTSSKKKKKKQEEKRSA
ncbi:hypothetical protein AM588_10002828 [Phytophthora nicotianae]|uniref:DNA helicase n=1 Tax=Phytophthora nicotianae TaxID=4792 RepID=A0A0W8D3D5_PHYNI|nr:hypothetical protein AM588_10002828 [Phytophthora nicotianae]